MTNTRPKANQLYQEAIELMPGGVNSPARAFRSVDMTPVFAEEGDGAYLTDVDGNRYICLLYTSPSPRD